MGRLSPPTMVDGLTIEGIKVAWNSTMSRLASSFATACVALAPLPTHALGFCPAGQIDPSDGAAHQVQVSAPSFGFNPAGSILRGSDPGTSPFFLGVRADLLRAHDVIRRARQKERRVIRPREDRTSATPSEREGFLEGTALPPTASNTGLGEPGSPTSCGGVVLATGEKFHHEVDFPTASLHGLDHSRVYRSKWSNGLMFGTGWDSVYEPEPLAISGSRCPGPLGMMCVPEILSVHQETGRHVFRFKRWISGGAEYTADDAIALGIMTAYTSGVDRYILRQGTTQQHYNIAGRSC
jgi:hypothetical protein